MKDESECKKSTIPVFSHIFADYVILRKYLLMSSPLHFKTQKQHLKF
jgi:hypothetical protein